MAYFRCTGNSGGSLKLRTAQGEIASFETNLPEPYQSVTVNVVATQSGSGTPYPPGGGVNRWNEVWEVGGIDDLTGNNYVKADRIRSTDYNPVDGNETYYLSMPSNGVWVYCYDENKAYISSRILVYANRTFTLLPNTKYIRLEVFSEYGTVYHQNISINLPATDHDYHPYANIRPINGHTEANITRCGVNLFGGEYNIAYKLHIPANTQFTISCNKLGVDVPRFEVLDASQTQIDYWAINSINDGGRNFRTFTLAYDVYYVKVFYSNSDSIQLNFGADIPYHAYMGDTATIEFGQTVYGGVLDVTRGKLHVTYGYVPDMSAYNFSKELTSGKYHYYSSQITNAKPFLFNELSGTLCSNYPTITRRDLYLGTLGCAFDDSGHFYIYNADYDNESTTKEDVKNDMSGVSVAYELATPFDIDLTPVQIRALVGENNVFADCGETEVEYLEVE